MGVLEPVCTGLVELVHEDSKDEKSACERSLIVDTLTRKVISVHAMNVLREEEVWPHSFLTSALGVGD